MTFAVCFIRSVVHIFVCLFVPSFVRSFSGQACEMTVVFNFSRASRPNSRNKGAPPYDPRSWIGTTLRERRRGNSWISRGIRREVRGIQRRWARSIWCFPKFITWAIDNTKFCMHFICLKSGNSLFLELVLYYDSDTIWIWVSWSLTRLELQIKSNWWILWMRSCAQTASVCYGCPG